VQVYVRWVTDSEKYNEWMNPMDYETEEAVEAHERKVRRSCVPACPFIFKPTWHVLTMKPHIRHGSLQFIKCHRHGH
jgi:hypothetical protein